MIVQLREGERWDTNLFDSSLEYETIKFYEYSGSTSSLLEPTAFFSIMARVIE
jgi:hypothetical protein